MEFWILHEINLTRICHLTIELEALDRAIGRWLSQASVFSEMESLDVGIFFVHFLTCTTCNSILPSWLAA